MLYLCEGIGALLLATSELKDLSWLNGSGFLEHYMAKWVWFFRPLQLRHNTVDRGCKLVGLVWTEHCGNMFMLNPDLTQLLITGPDLEVQMVD